MALFVKMFQPKFSELVARGEKRQTVRPFPVRMPCPGDAISLRAWTGLPYRSKQRVLRESVITEVTPVRLDDTGREVLMSVGASLSPEQIGAFAKADGFKGVYDFIGWFQENHGLPFSGIVIKWEA